MTSWIDDLPPDLYPIRLQGPWKWEDHRGGGLATVHLPLTSSQAAGLPDEARLLRTFHKPTRLDAAERVLLVLPPGATPVAVQLNQAAVGNARRLGACLAWDLTSHLSAPSQRLSLQFAGADWKRALAEPVLIGIMPDAGGNWWARLPETQSAPEPEGSGA
jgi:hypothetical protein